MRRLLPLALLLFPGLALAQGESALRKSDLVRYLTGTTYSKAEIADIVRRNCLAFVPSDRDRNDLRQLGANEAILREIDRCVRNSNRAASETRPAPRAARPAQPPQPLKATIINGYVSATSGSVAYVSVDVQRGDAPAPGQELVLQGATAIPGGAHGDPTAVTDARGRAVFAIPSGTRAGTYRLTLAAADSTPLDGTRDVTLATLPAAVSLVSLAPSVIAIAPGATGATDVTVTVTDAFGNRVANAGVQLSPFTSRPGLAMQSRQTTDSGTVKFSVPLAPLRTGDSLAVSVAGRRLAVLHVAAGAQVASQLIDAERRAAEGRTDAEAAYDSVLSVDPTNARALVGRGNIRSFAGNSAGAVRDFQAVLHAGTDRVGALTGLGYDALRRGDYTAASESFQQALQAESGDDAASTGLAYAELWRLDPRQAPHRAEALNGPRPTAYPASAGAALREGAAAFATHNTAAAERAFTTAAAAAPQWADVYYNRALVYQAEGRSERAIADFQKYQQLRPTARDRVAIDARIETLGRTPGDAFVRGLILPGLGQFYTQRPALGVFVLAGAAGGTVWALRRTPTTELHTFTDPFGKVDSFTVTVQKRSNLTTGLAVAGGVWLLGAVEAAIHAGSARGDPYYPTAPTAPPRRTASRAQLFPVVGFRETGPEVGAALRVEFR